MAIKYNYSDMRTKSNQLTNLVNEFVCSYKNVARNIDWQGTARDNFDDAVERSLSAVVSMMTEVSKMPQNAADQMENADKEEAARVRAMFPEVFY